MGKFAAIAPYFNPLGWKSRLRNYHQFAAAMLATSGVELWTIEAAVGEQPFELPAGPRTIQLRSRDMLWQKERMINLAVKRLPPEVDYVAWLDCDLLFQNPKWAEQAVDLLGRHAIIQLFESVTALGPDGQPQKWLAHNPSGAGSVAARNGQRLGRPGGAWAARRKLMEQVGLPDVLISGSGDVPVAYAALRKSSADYHRLLSADESILLARWERKFAAAYGEDGSTGFVPGVVVHLWHGSRENRRYGDRQKVLKENGFSPPRDLVAAPSGLWEWSGAASPVIRAALEDYFRGRNEDEGEAVVTF